MKSFNINRLLLLFFVGTLIFFSCKKEEFNPDFTLPRQFTPVNIHASSGETEARINWDPSLFTNGKNATSYTVQVAKDTSFTTVDFTQIVDTTTAVFTDSLLEVGQVYFARVRADEKGSTSQSNWAVSDSFKVTGTQIFYAVSEPDVTDSSVVLHWRPASGLTKITLTPSSGGTPVEVILNAGDTTAHVKKVTGLQELTDYTAKIFRNNTRKGIVSFTTSRRTAATTTLAAGDDLVAAIDNAADGDVIGLEPGTYDCSGNITISGKTVTVMSLSGNPNDTKVQFSEVDLKYDGAGLYFKGIEWDGTAHDADYFINLAGASSSSNSAMYKNIVVENCIVHHTNNCFLRGNRASNAGDQKVDSIIVKNSVAYDNGTGSYHYFMIDKLDFKYLGITNTTMFDIGRALLSWVKAIPGDPVPTILIDYTTINDWGFSGRNYILLDVDKNTVDFSVQNSILANTPKPGETVGSSLIRASDNSNVVFRNNDYFNLLTTDGDNPPPITFPSVMQLSNNLNIDLGWDASTTNFTLPLNSPVRTASTTGGPIGDPRWWY